MRQSLLCAVVIGLLLSLLATGTSCTKPKSTISFKPYYLDFMAIRGEPNPASQLLTIWNSGNGTLKWSISGDATWLTLSPTNGSSMSSVMNAITVAVDTKGISAGSYGASVTISSSGATNSPQTVPVRLTIVLPSAIQYSPSSLKFTATEGASNPRSQSIQIWNSGGGTLDWSISANATWLNLSPTSGSSKGSTSNSVKVAVDTIGMSAGNYSASITISCPNVNNTPQPIPVSFTMNPALPLTATPTLIRTRLATPPPTTTPTLTPLPTPTATPMPLGTPPPEDTSKPPCRFHGTVRVNGAVVPDGTVVKAIVQGDVYTTTTPSVYGVSTYVLIIGNPSGVIYDGKEVTFMINGLNAAETVSWTSGGNILLNLTAIGTP